MPWGSGNYDADFDEEKKVLLGIVGTYEDLFDNLLAMDADSFVMMQPPLKVVVAHLKTVKDSL